MNPSSFREHTTSIENFICLVQGLFCSNFDLFDQITKNEFIIFLQMKSNFLS